MKPEKYYCFLIPSQNQHIRVRADKMYDVNTSNGKSQCNLYLEDEQVACMKGYESWWTEWKGRHSDEPVVAVEPDPLTFFIKHRLRSVNWGSYLPGRKWSLGSILFEAGITPNKKSQGLAVRYRDCLYGFLEQLGFDRTQTAFGKYPKFIYLWNPEGK